MNQIAKRSRPLLFVALVLIISTSSWAFFDVLFSVSQMVEKAQVIFVAKVERIDPEKPGMVLSVGESLKGKPSFDRLPINLTGDPKKNHSPQLLKRLAADLPLIVFEVAKDDALTQPAMLFAYTNGTWFQVLGHPDGDQTRWAFTHCEIYLRRTFKGSTEELKQITADIIAGKSQGPPANKKKNQGWGRRLVRSHDESPFVLRIATACPLQNH